MTIVLNGVKGPSFGGFFHTHPKIVQTFTGFKVYQLLQSDLD